MTINTPISYLINVDNLSLARGERILVRSISFSLAAGQGLLLRGANGSGKTTLLRALSGFVSPLNGVIKLDKNEIQYLGHQDTIKPNENIGQQLEFWAKMYAATKSEIASIIDFMGIKHLLFLDGSNLSAGQKRRISLVRLLLSKRKIWLLDEPAAPLDEKGRKLLGQIFDKHRQNGGIIIAAVHDTPEGESMQELWLER